MDWFTDLLNFQPTKENLIHKFCLFFINSKTIPYTHNVTSRRLKSRVFSLLHYFFIVAITFYLTVSPLKQFKQFLKFILLFFNRNVVKFEYFMKILNVSKNGNVRQSADEVFFPAKSFFVWEFQRALHQAGNNFVKGNHANKLIEVHQITNRFS